MSGFTLCYHIVVYVPVNAAEEFTAVVSPHIPSFIGAYDHVCWRSAPGTGQFRPLEGAEPAEGEIGKIEQVPEIRFECLIPLDPDALSHFIEEVLTPAHPYEAPVIMVTETRLAGAFGV